MSEPEGVVWYCGECGKQGEAPDEDGAVAALAAHLAGHYQQRAKQEREEGKA